MVLRLLALVPLLALVSGCVVFEPVNLAYAVFQANRAQELAKMPGRAEDSLHYIDAALPIVERIFGPNDYYVATGYHQRGLRLEELNRLTEAEAAIQHGLAIQRKILRADHPEIASSELALGRVYHRQARNADADRLLKQSLARYERAFGPDSPRLFNVLAALGDLQREERLEEAERYYLRSITLLDQVGEIDSRRYARQLDVLGLLYRLQTRYADAETAHKRALAIYEHHPQADDTQVAFVLHNLGGLYLDQGRQAEADALLERSYEIFSAGGRDPGIGSSSFLVGRLQAQGRHDEAETVLKRIVETAEARSPGHYGNALLLNNLATHYMHRGRLDEAEALVLRAIALWEGGLGLEHPAACLGRLNLWQIRAHQKRFDEAETLLLRCVTVTEAWHGPDHLGVFQALGGLTRLYLQQDRRDLALAPSRRSVDIATRRFSVVADGRSAGTITERRSHRSNFVRHIGLVHTANPSDAISESFRVAQLAQTSSAGTAVAGMAARFAAADNALAGVIRERQDLLTRWLTLDQTAVAAANAPADRRDTARQGTLRTELARLGAQLADLDAQIAREFPQYAELSQPRPMELAAAQALLGADEAALVYLAGEDETWLWVLRRDRAALHKIALGTKALAAEVTTLRRTLDPADNPELAPFDAAAAHALYGTLLAPAAPLLAGAKHVLVVPDGALESLPLGVLVTAPPRDPGDPRAVAWLARDHAITVLPTIGSLRALRAFAAAAPAAEPFLGVGDPVLEGRPGTARGAKLAALFRGGAADVAAVRQLTPLPETADELRAVAQAMGAGEQHLLLGERASEAALRALALDRYRVLSFATHGLTSGDLQGLAEPALVLTPPAQASAENDGLLTASEVATLRLNADWVVLSACNTAAADGTPDAGGLSGLAKAFFYAGARSLLVSHWSVPSQATVKLVTGAFETLQREPRIGRAEALRRSMIAMLDDRSLPVEFAHPMAWAPFVLAGEGAAGR
jgi:CHAT domain-containing protein